MTYDHLLRPGKIGRLTIQNRIVMPSISTGLANLHGEVTPELLGYYRERALSGPGVVVAEVASVDAERGRYGYNSLIGNHPKYVSGLSRLAEAVQAGGARAMIQLYHVGRQTGLFETGGRPPLAPSAVYCKPMRVMPEAATLDDIEKVIDQFAATAAVVNAAGFDGVELHAGHGYLLSSFLSPFTNIREDAYGGSTQNRARIVLEIIRRIKAALPELIVGIRYNAADFVPGGLEPEEGVELARLFEQAGVDYLNVSCGMYESSQTIIEPVSFTEGWRVYLAEMTRKEVAVPVIAGGVIRNPDTADRMIAEGKADFVWVGRGILADPAWVNKVRTGRPDQIRPCLSCNVCIEREMKGRPLACTVNPRAGRETWISETGSVTATPKKILVAGGGPAGMTAAAELSRRGHRVVLTETTNRLGGLLAAAAVPPDKQRIQALNAYLQRELAVSGAEVRLNTRCTAALAQELGADAVIVATGARPQAADFYEAGDDSVVQAIDLLRKTPETGKRFLVAGGGVTGCETALWLSRNGNTVTLVESTRFLASGLQQVNRQELVTAMKRSGVVVLNECRIAQYRGGIAQITDKSGETAEREVDRLVLALGFLPEPELAADLEAAGVITYVIGDAREPHTIESGLYQAAVLARRL
ncbi:MAG: FAD-dependent oxidoreductase [Solirubrobacterales bacterium]